MKIIGVVVLFLLATVAYGQSAKFARESLSSDLSFIVEKIKNAHNNPFTCCTEQQFDQDVEAIRQQLLDSMDARGFITLLKPLFAKLGDEHAGIYIPGKQQPKAKGKKKAARPDVLHYEKAGRIGVLTVREFPVNREMTLEVWTNKIDSVFSLIREDRIWKLVIDISRNPGGNSRVGNILIGYFSDKAYKGYSLTWKRSDEYLELMKQYGFQDAEYEKLKCGEYLTVTSQLRTPADNPKRFRGKTWLAVGKKTFSSAMMFATIVKDNRLATLIGEEPAKGHPNHFGEMIVLQTPAVGLMFGFGVKHFIRPSGELENNVLEPDKKVDLSEIRTASDWKPYLK